MKTISIVILTAFAVLLGTPQIGTVTHGKEVHTASAATPGSNFCPHARKVQEWKEWRERNPNAHSRYDKKSVLNFGPTPEPDDMEPDPGGLGCGCSPEIALADNGCGWFHSQVYGLKHSN